MAEETTFKRLRHALLELMRGYPSYRFFGKIESYLPESKYSLLTLKEDGIIEFPSKEESQALNKKLTLEQWTQLRAEGKKEPIWYRLSPKGVDLAISIINLEYAEKTIKHSQRTLEYSEEMRKFTIVVVLASLGALFFAFAQIIVSLWF